ncbi:MAG: hypothetical protein ABEJ28_05535 [Salinigranum sp.]
MPSVLDAVRANDTVRHLVFGALLILFVRFALHTPLDTVAVMVVFAVGYEALDVLESAFDLPDTTRGTVSGAILLCLGGYGLVAGIDRWLTAFALLAGLWILADTYRTYRDGPIERSVGPYFEGVGDDTGEMMYRTQVAGRVARAVYDEPRTAGELAADLGLSEGHTRDVLDTLETRGNVFERDGVYHVDESRLGKRAALRRLGGRFLRRLTRPFRY